MTNDLVHLEFACQAREHCTLTFSPQRGNGLLVPGSKYSRATGDEIVAWVAEGSP